MDAIDKLMFFFFFFRFSKDENISRLFFIAKLISRIRFFFLVIRLLFVLRTVLPCNMKFLRISDFLCFAGTNFGD